MSNRLIGQSIHGSGCAFASALAAGYALGISLGSAVERAKAYVLQLMQTTKRNLAVHHLAKI